MDKVDSKGLSRFKKAVHKVKGKIRAEKLDGEHYPELTGTLLSFLNENDAKLKEMDVDVMVQFNELTKKVIVELPKYSAAEKVLEAHGWNGVCFDLRNGPTNFPSLASALSRLYYMHVWAASPGMSTLFADGKGDESTASISAASGLSATCVNIFKDERSIGAFVPNILYSMLSQPNCTVPSGAFAENSSIRDAMSKAVAASNADGVPLPPVTMGQGAIAPLRSSSIVSNRQTSLVPDSVASKLSPKRISIYGACLLADISGFTKLSSKFCERGLDGLDDLHDAASGFLGKYVQIVYSHGGDVISFAGDALICIFCPKMKYGEISNAQNCPKTRNEVLQECCERAVECSFALTDHFTEELTSHCGISCGDMSFASLGGFKRQWCYLLNGKPIDDLSSCVDDAKSRQIVVSPDVHAALKLRVQDGDVLISSVRESGNYYIENFDMETKMTLDLKSRFTSLPNNSKIIEEIKAFTPLPVLHAISSGTLDTISELRAVTTMFLKLDTYNPVTNRDPLTLQQFFYNAQIALSNFGGFMRQFLVDDKGCVLIAMWGVPSFTYSNNCVRAVACAIAIHRVTEAIGHKCSIGITSGNVYCGNIGSLIRRDFVGIGADVNLAARLMGKSKGRIFFDEKTGALLPPTFRNSLSKSEGLTLKGVSVPVHAYICDGGMELNAVTTLNNEVTFVKRQVADKIRKQLDRVAVKVPDAKVEHDSDSFTLIDVPSPKDYDPSKSVYFTIVEGLAGSGQGAVASLYKSYALKCRMDCYSISLRPGDINVKHGALSKLFLALVGSDNFNTIQKQEDVINKVIVASSDSDWNTNESRKSTLVAALGTIVKGVRARSTNVSPSIERCASGCDEDQRRVFAVEAESQVLSSVLYVLLAQSTCAVVIEDCHFCDASSWYGLSLLLTLPVSAAILLTTRIPPEVKQHRTTEIGESVTCERNGLMSDSYQFDVAGGVKSKVGAAASTVGSFFVSPMGSSSRIVGDSASFSGGATTFSVGRKGSTMFSSKSAKSERTSYHTDNFYRIIDSDKTLHQELTPLSFEDTKLLVQHEMQTTSDELPDEMISTIYEASSGNAFWCTEIVSFIMERGQEEFMKNHEGKDEVSALSTLIICRLEKLSTEQQVVVKHAAVVGEEFTTELLACTLPHRILRNIEESLTVISEHNFLALACEDPPTFFFPNHVIRNILYDLTPPRERSNIHRNLAEQVEGLHAHDLEPYYFMLSYHYGLCQDEAEKAFEFSVKAADIAVAQCQFEDGLVLLKKAHRVASSKEQMQTLLNSVRGGIAAICEKAEVSKFFRTAIFMNKDVSQNHQKYTALENRLVRKLDVLQPRDNSTVDTLVVPNSEGTVQVAPLAAVADTQKNVTEVPSFGGDESVIVKTSPCCTIC